MRALNRVKIERTCKISEHETRGARKQQFHSELDGFIVTFIPSDFDVKRLSQSSESVGLAEKVGGPRSHVATRLRR